MNVTTLEENQVSSIANYFSNDIVSVLTQDELNSIDTECKQIDVELYKMKMSAIEIGRLLNSINEKIKQVCSIDRSLKVSEVFEQVLKNRFGKNSSWGYNMVLIYKRFSENSVFIENQNSSTIIQLTRLNDDELNGIKKVFERGEKLTHEQTKLIIDMIISSRDDNEQLSALQEKINASELTISNLKALADSNATETVKANMKAAQMERELSNTQESLDKAVSKLLETQQEQSNLFISLSEEREIKIKALADLELAKKNIETVTVDVEIPPKGYVTIQESIDDITAKMEEAQAKLNSINSELEEKESILHENNIVSNLLTELLNEITTVAKKQIEIFSKSRKGDFKQSAEVIQKISDIAKQISSDVARQLS